MGTILSEEQIDAVWAQVCEYLKSQSSIRNSELRSLTGIDYDQAIYFFNTMTNRGKLVRTGKSSGTRYTMPQ